MSLIKEIHAQRPAVRHTMFALATGTALFAVLFFTYSSVQKDIFFAMHPSEEDRQEFLAQRAERRPKPLVAVARAADSLMASIGGLIGWDRDAGFDRGGQQDTLQGGVHLLPLSE